MAKAFQKCVNRCKIFCHVIKIILSPNIPTYFLWSGLAYLAATITIFILSGSVDRFLCNVFVPREKCAECTRSDLLMCPKPACYQSAMNLTIMEKATLAKDPLTESLVASGGDWHCLMLAKKADDPVQMALKMYDATTIGTLPQITNDCVTFHCQVMLTALQHPDLVASPKSVSDSCGNHKGSKQASDASKCVCTGLYQTISPIDPSGTATDSDQGKLQAMCRFDLPTTTTTTTTTSTSTTVAASGASVRLLDANLEDGGETILADEMPLSHCSGSSCELLPARQETPDDMQLTQTPDDMRRLDHVPPAQEPAGDPEINDGLPEYTVGEWSQCTCYQACNVGSALGGTSKRRVQCMSAKCKDPMPAVSKACSCVPCSDCQVQIWLFVVTITCAIEAGLCLIMWLSIIYMSSVPEANLTSLSWGQSFLGCFVTRIPLLIRLIVILNVGLACFLVFVTFCPEKLIKFETDCKIVPGLWVLTVVFASLMLLMVIAGALIRQFKRMDPFLFRPVRDNSPAPIRLIGKFIRSLGP